MGYYTYMNNTNTIAMKAGTKEDLNNVAGWCFNSSKGRMWVAFPLPAAAARRMKMSGGHAWARPFILEDGKRVVLA